MYIRWYLLLTGSGQTVDVVLLEPELLWFIVWKFNKAVALGRPCLICRFYSLRVYFWVHVLCRHVYTVTDLCKFLTSFCKRNRINSLSLIIILIGVVLFCFLVFFFFLVCSWQPCRVRPLGYKHEMLINSPRIYYIYLWLIFYMTGMTV